MKVFRLINELQKFDPDADVKVADSSGVDLDIDDIDLDVNTVLIECLSEEE